MFWSPSLSDVKKGLKRDVIILYKQDTDTNRIQIAYAKKREKNRTERNHKNDYQCKDDVEMKKREKNKIERKHKKKTINVKSNKKTKTKKTVPLERC